MNLSLSGIATATGYEVVGYLCDDTGSCYQSVPHPKQSQRNNSGSIMQSVSLSVSKNIPVLVSTAHYVITCIGIFNSYLKYVFTSN